MKICGYRLRDHIRLLAPFLGLITAVWLLRLSLDFAGAPRGVVRYFSVTVACAFSVLAATVMIHRSRFGSYPNVVASSLILVGWEQVLIILAIAIAALTARENIFTVPEFSGPGEGPHYMRHIIGQLTFGIGAGVLYGAAMGCLLLRILRMLLPPPQQNGKSQPARYALHR
jgi:hypothetical protein